MLKYRRFRDSALLTTYMYKQSTLQTRTSLFQTYRIFHSGFLGSRPGRRTLFSFRETRIKRIGHLVSEEEFTEIQKGPLASECLT